jgi:hypothetical protein
MGGTMTQEYAITGEFQVGSVVFGYDCMRKHKGRKQTGKPHPVRHTLMRLCAALMSARCVALQMGTPVTFGWPALWADDEVSFFMPRDGSETPALHWVSCFESCTVWTCTREVALQWCTPEWDSFYYFGSVPTPAERQLGYDSNFAHILATDLVYDPRDAHVYNDGWLVMYDDDDLTYGPDHHGERDEALPTPSTAMSVGRAPEGSGSVDAGEWLMDTGSGVDIVSRASVAGCKRFVTKNSGITLMTANGELDASDEIEVYIKCVDTHVRLLVLDDSPNVLSTGKLCVDQGWGFLWHPFSKTPYMTKPGSGERV